MDDDDVSRRIELAGQRNYGKNPSVVPFKLLQIIELLSIVTCLPEVTRKFENSI
jgi:hypothetical protein